MPEVKLAVSTIGWPTKAEAGRALGVSTKTIEKYVEQGKLRQLMQSQVNKPQRAVIDPESLERMVSERSEAKAVAVREAPENGASVVRELRRMFSHGGPMFVTLDEAVRITGLGRTYIKENIVNCGKIGPRGAVMYHRRDLEAL